MRRAFVFDQEKCMSCNTCTVACKDWNQVNPGPVRWRTQITHETNVTPFFFPLAMSCNHCKEPACAAACSLGAILKRDSDGAVYVDRTKCQSLQTCITACPFAAPRIADDLQELNPSIDWQVKHPMQKCNFCIERIDKGLDPICVASCPAHALESGDYDYLIAKYAARGDTLTPLNKSDFPYAYSGNNTDTEPSFLVKKRGTFSITRMV